MDEKPGHQLAEQKRPIEKAEGRRLSSLAATLTLTLVLLLGYIVSYCLLGTVYDEPGPGPPYRTRMFAYAWQERLFEPAAMVESRLIGGTVHTAYRIRF
jgi:hypothetical protein